MRVKKLKPKITRLSAMTQLFFHINLLEEAIQKYAPKIFCDDDEDMLLTYTAQIMQMLLERSYTIYKSGDGGE